MIEGKHKVLVAEDDKFLSTALGDKLEREGFLVVKANNGRDTISVAEAELPDLILLDLIMPQQTGFEVLAELKTKGRVAKIPVIILSNLGQESDIAKAKALGVIDYWVKSDIELKVIVARVKEFLNK